MNFVVCDFLVGLIEIVILVCLEKFWEIIVLNCSGGENVYGFW